MLNEIHLIPGELYHIDILPDKKIGIETLDDYEAFDYIYLIIEDTKVRIYLQDKWLIFEKSKEFPLDWEFANISEVVLKRNI